VEIVKGADIREKLKGLLILYDLITGWPCGSDRGKRYQKRVRNSENHNTPFMGAYWEKRLTKEGGGTG